MEQYFYLGLDLFTISFPLLRSFEQRITFWKKWSGLFTGIAIGGFIFLVWDGLFTAYGVWGFNDRFLVGPRFFGMPIEEWTFFLVVPYACMFLYEVMRYYVKHDILGKVARPLSIGLMVLLTVVGLFNLGKLYTSITFLGTAAFLAWLVFVHRPSWLGRFYLGYGISLIPFFLVNGILTGWLLDEPIVWYNNAENLGIRLNTIPVEDSIYLLLLLGIVTVCYERPLKRAHGDGAPN